MVKRQSPSKRLFSKVILITSCIAISYEPAFAQEVCETRTELLTIEVYGNRQALRSAQRCVAMHTVEKRVCVEAPWAMREVKFVELKRQNVQSSLPTLLNAEGGRCVDAKISTRTADHRGHDPRYTCDDMRWVVELQFQACRSNNE